MLTVTTISRKSISGLATDMAELYFWEVVCVGRTAYNKNFGHGIVRTYYKKETISSKNKLFTKKADAVVYLYQLQNNGYRDSFMRKYYSK